MTDVQSLFCMPSIFHSAKMAADGAASPAGFAEQELIKQLVDSGNELLQNPPASKEELLGKLERLGLLLSNVYQEPSGSFHEALQPSIKALFADGLLQHADLEVQTSTTYCMSEILRITAPDQPCDDKSIEEFFQLAIMAFRKLANVEDRCYSKAASILQTFAKYRLCVLMLDLELDALILEMFQLFLNSICPDNADALLPFMEAIMTMIIEDSEEISTDLLSILLTSAKKENQNPLNVCYVLGERVFRNSNVKLQQYIPGAVKSLGINVNDYAEIVELTWREAIKSENLDKKELAPNSASPRDVGTAQKLSSSDCPRETPSSDLAKVSGQDASCNTQFRSDQVNQNDIDVRNNPSHENRTSAFAAQKSLSPPTRRRGRKPNSLMKPEEGYDHTWINVEGKSDKTPCQGKESKKRIGRPRKHLVSKGSHFTSSQSLNTIEDFQTRERRAEEEIKPSDGEQLMPVSDSLKRAEEENKPSDGGFRSASTKKRSNNGETSKKRKRKCSPSEKAARKQAEKLVGSRIKVWWPIDQTFYEGSIASFDYFEKKHKVNYDDGDVEDLDLSIERWELIRDVKSAVDEQETVAGGANLSEIKLDHVTNSDRSARSTCKARDGAELPVVKPEVEQRKVSRSNSAPSTSERAQDASVELPVVKQEVEKRKVIRIKPTHQRVRNAAAELPVGEEGEKPKNKRRRTKKATPRFPVLDSEKVNVKGYQVKASAAPILEEIFEKHGDIAANCPYPSRGFRASVFEVICDVIRELRTNDWGTIVSMVGQMRTEVSDTAAAAHLEVSWLKQILDDISTEDDGQLASVIRNTALVSKAARKDLTQRKAELVIAERSYEEAKRQLERAEQSKRTAERAVEVLESVKKKAQNDMELNFNKRNDLQNRFFTLQ
ncbi:uncharacterized protein LOC116009799 isoform X2 [Ipomoea triloba]|uniref:uncharacterized protein LOC116009799 isoform X2 n=1 Tax=Ipomoea triloba TaxID=35885 RepID=UPI00125E8867|nr:uncharacterized protein LOC116009799 isoform X2 [Ipomoea triloba]